MSSVKKGTLADACVRIAEHAFDAGALPAAERELIGRLWARRAQSELSAGVVFANISSVLLARGAAKEVAWLAARAVSDEVRHAEICRLVAARYLDTDVEFPTARPIRKPAPGAPEAALVATLHVVLNCCLNESIATVFLRTCLDEAKHEFMRAALRELLREEVDHARIGWAHLAWVSNEERRAVAQALPRLVAEVREVWLADNADSVPAGHGCLSVHEVEQVVDTALTELIEPGFEQLGVVAARCF